MQRRCRSADEVVKGADTVGRKVKGKAYPKQHLPHENGCVSGTLTLPFPGFHLRSPCDLLFVPRPKLSQRSQSKRHTSAISSDGKNSRSKSRPTPIHATLQALGHVQGFSRGMDKTTLGASSSLTYRKMLGAQRNTVTVLEP